jgi:hypothetical protein
MTAMHARMPAERAQSLIMLLMDRAAPFPAGSPETVSRGVRQAHTHTVSRATRGAGLTRMLERTN